MENKCKLCGSEYDFRMVQICELYGKTVIALSGSLRDVNSTNAFKYCPACGRKLTKENYDGKQL